MQMKKRITWVDVGKGTAILLVLFGHCEFTPRLLRTEIYSFHMPLFFFLSGYVFSTRQFSSFRHFVAHKFKSLMVPYFYLTSLLFLWVQYRNHGNLFSKHFIQGVIGILIQVRQSKYYVSMWYLSCLFLAGCLLYFIIYITKNDHKLLILCLVLCSLLGYSYIIFVKEPLPWHFDIAVASLPFMGMGYICSQKPVFFNRVSKVYYLPIAGMCNLVFSSLNFIKHGQTDIFANRLGNYGYYYLSAIFGIWASIIVFQKINSLKVLQYIGKNSLIFYAFQNSIALPDSAILIKHLFLTINLLQYTYPIVHLAESILCVFIACIELSIITYILKRCFPFMLGKIGFRDWIKVHETCLS